MRKFSKLNESYLDTFTEYTINLKIDPSVSDAIIEAILHVYPDKNLLRMYGYEKAVKKVVHYYLFSHNPNHLNTINDLNDMYNELREVLQNEEDIEQLFLEDLTMDEDILGEIFKKVNRD